MSTLLLFLFATLSTILGSFSGSPNTSGSPNERFLPVRLSHPDIAYEGGFFANIAENRVQFNRFDNELLAHPESGVSTASMPYALTQTGMRIRFITDSDSIRFQFKAREYAAQTSLRNGFGIHVFRTDAETRYEAFDKNSHQSFETLNFTVANVRDDQTTGPAEITVHLPTHFGVDLYSIEIRENATIFSLPKDERDVYVTIGNSIAHGTGVASATLHTWPYLFAMYADLNLYNVAIAGARSSWVIPSMLKGRKVDIITLSTGFNDWMWSDNTLSEASERYAAMLDTLLHAQPEADIWVITPLVTTVGESAMGAPYTLDAWRSEIARLVQVRQESASERLHLIHGPDFAEPGYLMDGVHLSRDGARSFARRLQYHMPYGWEWIELDFGCNLLESDC